jgi:glycogen debranching enzyme
MPDTWEYPWYAAWDLAFHCIPLTLVDPEFAKQQLILLLREWYMHPTGGHLEQSDGTAWMGMYCLNMLMIALELARENHTYEDVATKFFEHFLYIADALNNIAGEGISLWDEQDEFFYDVLHMPDDSHVPLRVRSLVGFIPLQRMLDPEEFLSDYGIRAISKYHAEHPYDYRAHGMDYIVTYEPGESSTGLFGGNSNWRGPIWFPINFLLIETLQKFHSEQARKPVSSEREE